PAPALYRADAARLRSRRQALAFVGIGGQVEREARALPAGAFDGQFTVHRAGQAPRDVEPKAGSTATAASQPLELLEGAHLLFGAQALALVGDHDAGAIALTRNAQPDDRSLGRIADRVAYEIEQDLQHTTELADGANRLAIPGGIDADAALPGANAQDTRRAAGKVGEIDPGGRSEERRGGKEG